ncbi:TIRAP isoform 5 [Pongo abelii]|uniref:TIRAP isoform 5 n=1 Tax=Pongo abelii TaxID=9601 RepID=A0A2J8WZP0_PONAB|nr:TIRAP isoform 5 [Pongo abelii]
MASSTSLPAPGSRPKKPLGKMAATHLTLHYLS